MSWKFKIKSYKSLWYSFYRPWWWPFYTRLPGDSFSAQHARRFCVNQANLWKESAEAKDIEKSSRETINLGWLP